LVYKGAARYDDVLRVEVWVSAAARVRLNFVYRILNQSADLLVEAQTNHTCTAVAGKVKRLPQNLSAALQPFLDHPSRAPS
jgi:acyl-CoA thioesterase FadM